jgi:GTP diphosphokinase / guanosine-3',5'-bis(diphosphate) 3'-diphosphatase
MKKQKLAPDAMFALALSVAKKAHRGQYDKSGKNYIHHPITVSDMLDTPLLKTVGLLHDVVEDSDFSLSDLKNLGFSKKVISAVDAISKRDGETYSHYVSRVKKNKIAMQVKIADATHNSDLTRIKNPSDLDKRRSGKYAELADDLKTLI